MSEGHPNKSESKEPGRVGWVREDSTKLKLEKIVTLATELSESQEGLPFPGIDPEAYAKLKAAEAEDPGYSTPIDTIIEKFNDEGIKVVLGPPKSGSVFILPGGSSDIDDSVSPKHLQVSEGMNEKLKELILLSKS